MIKFVDRAFAALLFFGALGHAAGSFTLLPIASDIQVWSLGSALAAALIAAANFIRAGRPGDAPVIWMALAGAAGWLIVVILFGRTLGNFLDFRVVWHGLCAIALAGFSLRMALNPQSPP